MHGLDASTWTYQFSDTLVCRSARCNDLPCYLPSCYRSHTTYFKRGAGAVRVIDRWEQFQEMPSPKPTTQPPFICFLFLKKEEPCTLCPGMSNMVRLTCRGGTSCSLQGQGWGLMTVWSQPKSEQSLKEGCSPPSSDLHTPTASLRWLPADSAGNNPESKERHCKFDNFLGTFDYMSATEVLKMHSHEQPDPQAAMKLWGNWSSEEARKPPFQGYCEWI